MPNTGLIFLPPFSRLREIKITPFNQGGGVLLEEKNSGALNKRDAALIGVFLSLCHTLVEDTLIFAAIGANLIVILLARICFAVAVLFLLRWLLPRQAEVR